MKRKRRQLTKADLRAMEVSPGLMAHRVGPDGRARLEQALAELPGVEEKAIASVAERAGNSSRGMPPRPRVDDPIGTSSYAVEVLHIIAEALRDQERRISELEAEK